MMRETDVRPYRVIRIALLAGVLLFGGVCWYVVSRQPPAPDESLYAVLQITFGAALLAVVGAFLVLRRVVRRADAQRRPALTVAGWALGEAPALLGGVTWLLTGRPLLYLAGTTLMVAAFIMFPLGENA